MRLIANTFFKIIYIRLFIREKSDEWINEIVPNRRGTIVSG